MTNKEFYGEKLSSLEKAEKHMLELTAEYLGYVALTQSCTPHLTYHSRIKSADSMLRKLKDRGFEVSLASALTNVYDAVGIRIICGFLDDVYRVSEWLEESGELTIMDKKDYIAYPKPNGYRSLHLCVRIKEGVAKGVLAEIQIRTMAIDFWATLEHQLKYKKEIKDENLIRNELKRCADEIAATDISMQTIKDMIELDHNLE